MCPRKAWTADAIEDGLHPSGVLVVVALDGCVGKISAKRALDFAIRRPEFDSAHSALGRGDEHASHWRISDRVSHEYSSAPSTIRRRRHAK